MGDKTLAATQLIFNRAEKAAALCDPQSPNKCQRQRNPSRERTSCRDNDGISKWLAGSQQESKKVFSFKNPARTFGFVKPGLIDFNTMKQRLTNAWGQNGWNFLTGDKIIVQLFAVKEDC